MNDSLSLADRYAIHDLITQYSFTWDAAAQDNACFSTSHNCDVNAERTTATSP